MAAQNSGPNEQVRSRVQEPGRVSEAVESPFMASMQDDSAVNRHSTDFYTRPSVSSARHSVSKRQSVVAGHKDATVKLPPLPHFERRSDVWRRFHHLSCARFLAQDSGHPYVVLGIFYKGAAGDTIPNERIVHCINPQWIFWQMYWGIVQIRGVGGVFSLKDVRRFKLYRCSWDLGSHEHIEVDTSDRHKLRLLLNAYNDTRLKHHSGKLWLGWVQTAFNNGSTNPTGENPGTSLSLEVVLGWSAWRITIATFIPLGLSLAIGIWYQWGNEKDPTIVQTAWTISGYVVTAAALLAALLAMVTGAST